MIFEPDPFVGQVVTFGDRVWSWDGEAWISEQRGSGVGLSSIKQTFGASISPSVFPLSGLTTVMVQV